MFIPDGSIEQQLTIENPKLGTLSRLVKKGLHEWEILPLNTTKHAEMKHKNCIKSNVLQTYTTEISY
jgi:hypothetical protein